MGTMAYGMWRARYWAVLGFQALLVIVLVAGSLGLLAATTLARRRSAPRSLIVGAGALFYFMIKAMARIQMPDRPGAETGPTDAPANRAGLIESNSWPIPMT